MIQVTTRYALGWDVGGNCWTVVQARMVKGELRWESIRWYPHPDQALSGLAILLLDDNARASKRKSSSVETVTQTVIDAIDAAAAKIREHMEARREELRALEP